MKFGVGLLQQKLPCEYDFSVTCFFISGQYCLCWELDLIKIYVKIMEHFGVVQCIHEELFVVRLSQSNGCMNT
jgi:hypothetical protein